MRRSPFCRLSMVAVSTAVLLGCGGTDSAPPASDAGALPTLDGASETAPPSSGEPGPICDGMDVFLTNCTGAVCHHDGEDRARGLDLLSPGIPDRIIGAVSTCNGRLIVDPDHPEESFLLEKISSDTPECGSRMPFLAATLSDDVIECVRQWIVDQVGGS